jgi:hypothetical protein
MVEPLMVAQIWLNHGGFQELKTWFDFQELKSCSTKGINSWA